jgi:hypothetical protein
MVALQLLARKRHRLTKRRYWKSANAMRKLEPSTKLIRKSAKVYLQLNRISAIRRLKKFTPKQFKNVLPTNLLHVSTALKKLTKRSWSNALQMVALQPFAKKKHKLTKRSSWNSVNAKKKPSPPTKQICNGAKCWMMLKEKSARRDQRKHINKHMMNALPKNQLSVNNSLMSITKRRRKNALLMVVPQPLARKRHRLTKRQCWKSVNAAQRPEPTTQKT